MYTLCGGAVDPQPLGVGIDTRVTLPIRKANLSNIVIGHVTFGKLIHIETLFEERCFFCFFGFELTFSSKREKHAVSTLR